MGSIETRRRARDTGDETMARGERVLNIGREFETNVSRIYATDWIPVSLHFQFGVPAWVTDLCRGIGIHRRRRISEVQASSRKPFSSSLCACLCPDFVNCTAWTVCCTLRKSTMRGPWK